MKSRNLEGDDLKKWREACEPFLYDGYDPYNSFNTRILYVRPQYDGARKICPEDSPRAVAVSTLKSRKEISDLMPWEVFPDGVNISRSNLFD